MEHHLTNKILLRSYLGVEETKAQPKVRKRRRIRSGKDKMMDHGRQERRGKGKNAQANGTGTGTGRRWQVAWHDG